LRTSGHLLCAGREHSGAWRDPWMCRRCRHIFCGSCERLLPRYDLCDQCLYAASADALEVVREREYLDALATGRRQFALLPDTCPSCRAPGDLDAACLACIGLWAQAREEALAMSELRLATVRLEAARRCSSLDLPSVWLAGRSRVGGEPPEVLAAFQGLAPLCLMPAGVLVVTPADGRGFPPSGHEVAIVSALASTGCPVLALLPVGRRTGAGPSRASLVAV